MKDWQMFQRHCWWMQLIATMGVIAFGFTREFAAMTGMLVVGVALYCTTSIISAIRGDK